MTIELWFLLVAFYAFWAGAVSENKVINGWGGIASVAAGALWPILAIIVLRATLKSGRAS